MPTAKTRSGNAKRLAPKVRQKSTHRKRRSEDAQREQLAPVQIRSRRRHEEILRAAERLLSHANIEDISHNDIAVEAGISKPSVHYHFPTIAALQRELGARFDEELSKLMMQNAKEVTPKNVRSWHDFTRIGAEFARDYFNNSRAACEALYGPMLHRDNRLAAMGYNSKTGAVLLEAIQRRFELPSQNLEEVFTYSGEIIDLFWSGSYLSKGKIDERAFEESMRASIGYLRNFLPDILPLRSRTKG